MRIVAAEQVRAAIAAHLLGEEQEVRQLGDVTLYRHQQDAVVRLLHMLDTHRGALLADDVGLGKTFVALAVARSAPSALVIAPAATRDAWREASRLTRVPLRWASMESLSRGDPPGNEAGLVIVDEAHHFRTTATRRYRALTRLCHRAKVLLLSATPVQNRLEDLRVLLGLFLGERARALSADELAAFVVRRLAGDLGPSQLTPLPRVAEPEWLPAVDDVDCLDRLLSLPRAVPPTDGDDGGALLTYSLMRQWASSRSALCAALHRRLARSCAMEDALNAGRLPSRAELRAWSFAEGTQQLAFPELVASGTDAPTGALLEQVRRHSGAVRSLLQWLGGTRDPDLERARLLAGVLERHAGERVVAFSEYTQTVIALYRALMPLRRVALLTHAGGRVAGGMLTRRELLGRFAPGASARAPEHERIDLLLTTDVLSEGVDLQDASVLVHLDLAWNPARLEQRVGRLRRFGAARDSIAVYLMAPPAPAERLLRLEQRLRVKLGDAARAVGVAGAILPGVSAPSGDSAARREGRIAATLRGWWSRAPVTDGVAGGVASCGPRGALACVRLGDGVLLVGVVDGRVTDARNVIEELVGRAGGPSVAITGEEVREARQAVESWMRRRVVSDIVDLPALRVAGSRQALLRRVDTISRRASRHAQAHLAPLMRAVRSTATATLSSGAERVLDELARSPMPDEAWLHAVGEFAAIHVRPPAGAPAAILAILVLVPPATATG